jgi:hypothetical protein
MYVLFDGLTCPYLEYTRSNEFFTEAGASPVKQHMRQMKMSEMFKGKKLSLSSSAGNMNSAPKTAVLNSFVLQVRNRPVHSAHQ